MSVNQKKKTGMTVLIIGIIVLVLAAAVFLLIKLGVFGGGKNVPGKSAVLSQEEIAQMPFEEAARRTVGSFLALYQSCDTKAGEYAQGLEGVSFPPLQAAVARSMKYSVDEVRIEKSEDGTEQAMVKITVDTVSFRSAFEEAMKEIPQDADSGTILGAVESQLERLAKSGREKFSLEVPVLDFVVSRKIQMTPELSDALTGGMMSYVSEQTAGGELNE